MSNTKATTASQTEWVMKITSLKVTVPNKRLRVAPARATYPMFTLKGLNITNIKVKKKEKSKRDYPTS